jgi:hypothetical protein
MQATTQSIEAPLTDPDPEPLPAPSAQPPAQNPQDGAPGQEKKTDQRDNSKNGKGKATDGK